MNNDIKDLTSSARRRAAIKKKPAIGLKTHKQVWVFVEQRRGQVHPVSWEVMGVGREFADKLQADLAAVVIGQEGDVTSNTALDSFCYGANLAYVVADNMLSVYRTESYNSALTDLVNVYKPEILLLGATRLGRALAGSLATTLLTALPTDCTYLDVDVDGSLATTHPSFGGSMLCTIYNLKCRPQIATVRPHAMPIPKPLERGAARIIIHPLDRVEPIL
nr:hypothetical protein [Bradyrhizobium mercantei]